MSVVLYGSRSTASMVVHWLLIELEVPHTLQLLDFERHEHKFPAYLQLNPAGVVPTLVINGEVVTEAAAIVMHLADLYPQAGLAPAPGTTARAHYYRWMLFMANTMQPAYRAWFYPAEPAGEGSEDAVKQQARRQIETAWARVADHLASSGAPYLLGEQRSAADFMLTMLMRWSRNMPTPADALPALQAHAMLMKVRPSFKEVYAREGLTDWT
ncbi:MAG: glutathione S-transferase family protein [Pseudoxanthomonas sp.]|nr:glutathione S-transferase family protein [Pseudoxanthomonas sp.]